MTSDWFDRKKVQHSFSRAAERYDEAAKLQRMIDATLMESLEYIEDPGFYGQKPRVIVDAGSGTGASSKQIQAKYPDATVFSVDAAQGMLKYAQPPKPTLGERARKLFSKQPNQPIAINADVRNLPFADSSVDVIYSNLCLQWVEDLQGVLNGFRRVLKPGGMVLFSTFGPETLIELREAFAQADDETSHVSPFANIQQWGDALIATGFRNPVLDRDVVMEGHASLKDLMKYLKDIGATNALNDRRKTLTGRARFNKATGAYEQWRDASTGKIPVTWEVIYATAWAPNADQPIREQGVDLVRIPVNQIKIRKRSSE